MLIFSLRIVFTGVSTTLAGVQSVRLHQLARMVTESSCHRLIILVYNSSWCLLVTYYYDYMFVVNWLNSLKNIPNILAIMSCQCFLGIGGLLFCFYFSILMLLTLRTWSCLETKLQIIFHCYSGHQSLLTHSLYFGYKS